MKRSVVLLALLAACGDATEPDRFGDVLIRGTVVDELMEPVSVPVVLLFQPSGVQSALRVTGSSGRGEYELSVLTTAEVCAGPLAVIASTDVSVLDGSADVTGLVLETVPGCGTHQIDLVYVPPVTAPAHN